MITLTVTAELLGLSYRTILRYMEDGDLRAVNVRPRADRPTWRVSTLEIERITGMKVEKNEHGFMLVPRTAGA